MAIWPGPERRILPRRSTIGSISWSEIETSEEARPKLLLARKNCVTCSLSAEWHTMVQRIAVR
jgi:hypothetical protein